MKCMVLAWLTLCMLMSAIPAANAREPGKPNVVIIFIDDLGYGDIGPFGATKQKTPNLNRMAAEGMKLTSFYAAPVCSVSRAQMMTGCYGARVSVPGVFSPASKNGLHPNEVTMAERLKAEGYQTMCIGKWHLGDQPEFLPTKQGFDHYFGIPYSNDMQRKSTESGKSVVPLMRDEAVVDLLYEEDQRKIVERYTAEAVSFIQSSKDKPFLLYFPHSAVHTPIWPGEAFRGKSENGRFGDWVEEVDWSVGQVFEALRANALDKNTLVIFTSDNGPWLIKGADGGSALPLRGGKGSTWEGGVRVPTIAWWPGKIAAGSRCDAVAGTIDLLPTVVSIAGGKVPAEPVIDGRDLTPNLLQNSTQSQREAHYYFSGYNLQAVRQGPWKLAVADQAEPVATVTATINPAQSLGNPRLYNLDQEISEQTNLVDRHPEIVSRLKTLLEKKNSEIGGTEPTARRPAGTVENPHTVYPSEAPKPNNNSPRRATTSDLSQAKIGDVIAGDTAPRVANLAFQLSFEVETAARDAVLVAHGGSAVGYAVHLRGGKLLFFVNDGTDKTEIETAYQYDGKPHRITAGIKKDGALMLRVDNASETLGTGKHTITRQPKENLCIGFDDGVPVTTYSSNDQLSGVIKSIKFSQ